jgi:hypothetical protein
MMPRRHGVETKNSGSFAESIKLQMSVALNAWVWCNAVNMSLHVWCDNMLVEVI